VSDAVVLAIDLGTGGPKVAAVDASGTVLGWRSRAVATSYLPDGGAEQDPHEMWDAVVVATRTLLAEVAIPRVAAVAVTSQYMSSIPVAADGSPTGPCITWMDTRGAANSRELLTAESFALYSDRHGMIPLPSGSDGVAHVSVLRHLYPDSYRDAVAFVEPMDFITAQLTGRVTATQSTVFGLLASDNRTWGGGYDPELVATSRLDPDRLAPLVPMNDVLGELTSWAADALGVAAGVPVFPGTIDSITGAVGSGALDATDGSVVIGTTSVLVTHVRVPSNDLFRGLLSVPSPLPDRWFLMAENGLGGRALDWVLGLVGWTGQYDDAFAAAGEVPAGSDGAAFFPWLLGSLAPSPDDDARGAFTGLSMGHDRRHLVRSTLEGVALNMAWMLPAVEEFIGRSFSELRFGGGGAQSPMWGQILADACDVRIHRLGDPRVTNARGAALLTWWQLGLVELADIPAMLPVTSVHDPDPAHRAVMDAALQRMVATHAALASARSEPA
jgi:xylulokinase